MILLTVLIMSSLTRFVQQVIPFTISSHRIGQVIFVSEVNPTKHHTYMPLHRIPILHVAE